MTEVPTPSPPVSILIAEDHELARYGLTLTLEGKPSVRVVAEAENGQQAVALTEQHHPDVVLMDIGMPVMDGITATQTIKSRFPKTKVIMLTSHKDEEEVLASLAAGAEAYCMKDIKVDRLCQVIEMVMEDAVWLDPAIAAMVLQTLPALPLSHSTQTTPVNSQPDMEAGESTKTRRIRYNATLTEREREVLELIVQGKSNKEIAQILEVTTHTAKAHVGNIIQKLAVDDRTQVAVKAIQAGMVSVHPLDSPS